MTDSGKSREKVREAKLEVREEGGRRSVRVSVSSETPVPEVVFDAESGEWVRALEVLGHGDGEIDFSRMADGLVIQDTHRGDQIGLIRSPEVKDGKLGGEIEFCAGQRAQEIKSDAERGLRRNMSVGYVVNEWRKVEDGDRKAGKLPTYRAVSWTPYEASFVNVPADTRVGVDRASDIGATTAAETAATKERNQHMAEPKNPSAVEKPAVSADEFRAMADKVNALEARLAKPEVPAARAKPQFDQNDAAKIMRKYSLMTAIRALAGEKVDCGFERELSDEIAHQSRREARGFFIPDVVFRDVLLGKTNVEGHIVGNGAVTVATDLLSGQFIDALVAKTVLGAAGVQTLSGLVGDVAIPTGGSVNAAWIDAEDGDATNTDPTFGQINATPHTVAAKTDISRKLMIQSSISVQSKVSGWILDAIARAIETAAYSGTGTNGQPKGVENIAGVSALTLTADAPTHGELVDAWAQMETDNVSGSFKWIGSPRVKALLAKTRDTTKIENKGKTDFVAAVGSDYLCTKDGMVEGYPFIISNLCNAKKLYFADWSQMLLAFWSGVDLTVDPYSLSTKGALRLVAFQDCDVIVRQPKAFQVGTALS